MTLWQDDTKSVFTSVPFDSPIVSVKLKRTFCIIATSELITILNFPELLKIAEYSSFPSDKDTLVINSNETQNIVAFAGTSKGSVTVLDLNEDTEFTLDNCHDNEIHKIGISKCGSFIATCSERGTLIRVFRSDKKGEPVYELRRGKDKAKITSLTFNATASYLAVASSKGTIHIFCLLQNQNKKSVSSAKQVKFPPDYLFQK